MNKKQILTAIYTLALSQGSYGSLYNRLTDGSESSEQILSIMEKQNFSDVADMVMWLES